MREAQNQNLHLLKVDAMNKIKALIQQNHTDSGKMVLQALIPFMELKDTVLFTCKASSEGFDAQDNTSIAQENYKFYQRRIDENRLLKIERYISQCILSEAKGYSVTALFPSSLILAFKEDDGNFLEERMETSCSINLQNNVFIVDGQHRMMAMKSLYSKLSNALFRTSDDEIVFSFLKSYKFNCVLLVNYDLWEQGQVFVNVNFNQKPVNKSLYYEVFGSQYYDDPSQWKNNHIFLAHNLAKVLNENANSPYYKHVKMIGTGKGYVSQAFIVEALMRHYALNGIWSIYKTRKGADDDVNYMAVELLSYFAAVKKTFKEYWPDDNDKGDIICKTTGTGAFIRLMYDVHQAAGLELLETLNRDKVEISEKYMQHACKLFERIKKDKRASLFGKESNYSGSSGKGSEVKLYKELRSLIFNNNIVDALFDAGNLPINEIAEQLQEYLWINVESDLDCLGHRYEYEELSDLEADNIRREDDIIHCDVTFSSGITIYIDSDDQTGFNMCFPSKASITMRHLDGKWMLDEDSVKAEFDTSKYYQ